MAAIRILNEEGLRLFKEYLAESKIDATATPPMHLLTDGSYSDPFQSAIEIEFKMFADALEFGEYLADAFSPCEAREISRNHSLWSWLALYYIDYLAPKDEHGRRKLLEEALYVLDARFIFRRYYRHLVRAPWQSVRLHGKNAQILLLSSGKGSRTEVAEQLGAYLDIFGCPTVIAAANSLWFNENIRKPRRGSGGKGAGSPRRLVAVVRQLQLTYDLADCPLSDFLKLLPKEFDRWRATTVSGGAKSP